MSPHSDAQAFAVVAAVRDILRDGVAAVYVYGSAVMGGLRPDSDLDLLAVTRRRMSAEEMRRLIDRLVPLSARRARPADWRPVELTMVCLADVRPWRFPPRMEFQHGEWLRIAFDAGELEPWSSVNPDLAILVAMVLRHGRPLLGPPPGELLEPVPYGDLRRAMLAGIEGLLDDLATDTRNVLLTLARMWCTAATGEIRSKDAAAGWAFERLPEEHRSVLARARTAYLDGGDEAWDELVDRVRACAAFVVGEIRGLAEH